MHFLPITQTAQFISYFMQNTNFVFTQEKCGPAKTGLARPIPRPMRNKIYVIGHTLLAI